MTRVFLIRHAEAEGNLYRRGHGHYDGKITKRGRSQIDALAERFKDERIDALYSSDLSRARDTAGAISRYHEELKLITRQRLREINMGCWEDMSWGDIAHNYGDMLYKFNFEPESWTVPGAESFENLSNRICAELREIAAAHEGQTIAVISHGMAIRCALIEFLGNSVSDKKSVPHADNTAVSLLEIEPNGAVRVIYMNDASHMGEGLSTFQSQTWWRKEDNSLDLGSLRFELLDPYAEAGLYMESYADSWRSTHGSLLGFDPEYYLGKAREHASINKSALTKAFSGEKLAGIEELDPIRGEREGYGWISLCYMRPEYRGMGFGIQLIGYAVSVFRGLERDRIRLHVAEENKTAVRFYKKLDFAEIDREHAALGDLLLMEKFI